MLGLPTTNGVIMQVKNGQTVKMRDGRIVIVTDAAEPGPYETIDRAAYLEQGREVITSSMPGETIFVGSLATVGYEHNPNGGYGKMVWAPTNQTVVSDMSEVVSIFR